VARGKARKTTRARKAKAKGRSAARVAAGKGRAKTPAKTAQARKKGLPAKVSVAKRSTKKVVGKRTVVSAAAGPDVELAVPELAVTTSVQGEVPAGGE
jgi:hypothetical protein